METLLGLGRSQMEKSFVDRPGMISFKFAVSTN